jgi:hypothetical protein
VEQSHDCHEVERDRVAERDPRPGMSSTFIPHIPTMTVQAIPIVPQAVILRRTGSVRPAHQSSAAVVPVALRGGSCVGASMRWYCGLSPSWLGHRRRVAAATAGSSACR